MVISEILVPLKAYSPIDFTLAGIVISSRPVEEKEDAPIEVTVEANETVLMLSQDSNKKSPRAVIPEDTIIFLIFEFIYKM